MQTIYCVTPLATVTTVLFLHCFPQGAPHALLRAMKIQTTGFKKPTLVNSKRLWRLLVFSYNFVYTSTCFLRHMLYTLTIVLKVSDVLKAQRRLRIPWYELGSYFRSCLTLPGDRPTPIALGPTSRTTITGLVIPDDVGGGAGSTGCPLWEVDLGLGMPVSGLTLKDSWAGFDLLLDASSLVCGGSLAATSCEIKCNHCSLAIRYCFKVWVLPSSSKLILHSKYSWTGLDINARKLPKYEWIWYSASEKRLKFRIIHVSQTFATSSVC